MLDAGVAMSLCFVFLFTEWRYLFPVIIVIMTLPKNNNIRGCEGLQPGYCGTPDARTSLPGQKSYLNIIGCND